MNNMKKNYLIFIMLFALCIQQAVATSGITLTFNRTGTSANSVTVNVLDESGESISGASATFTSSHDLRPTAGAITSGIICPNINANTSPEIKLTVTIEGMSEGFSYNKVNLDIHALNGGSNYQENNDGVTRQWNVTAKHGTSSDALSSFGSLNDIDIAAGIGTSGAVHKVWEITSATTTENAESIILELTITKGTTNPGCFFGLSEIEITSSSTEPEPEPEPEPTPDVDDSEGKVYTIQWKNTGTNYITEGDDNYMTVADYNVTKYQFWKFIPTENENCYYIKNTATGRYIGSCNLTPSSASRVTTTTTPVEYYVAPTSATSGEIAGCHYFSSTDCSNYNSESSGPRALNKDGASSYVITWQAGTSRVGSYWKLIETGDLYEPRPYDASSAIGNITASYYIESLSGKNITLGSGSVSLSDPDMFDTAQEWYFVGTGNSNGWQIVSASSPATIIGIEGNDVVANETTETKWKVNISQDNPGYYYFTKIDDEATILTIDGEHLFRFNKLRSAYSRRMQIYNNPCGIAGSNYITQALISGENVLETLNYTAQSKPSNWHVVYAHDKAVVSKNKNFEISLTLASTAASDMVAYAYFDWDCNGIFETEVPITIDANNCNATTNVPEWATEKESRMRIRLNSNGLNLAEDDVEGFVYDFIIKASKAQTVRTVSVTTNSWERGTAVLSQESDSCEYGTQLTATATAIGTSSFICWREGSIVVSTEAEYTFTVDHNIALTAYFSPNTDEDSWTGIDNTVAQTTDIKIEQNGRIITATADCNIHGMQLYNIDASLMAKSNTHKLNAANIPAGIYIVRINTEKGCCNIKFYLK